MNKRLFAAAMYFVLLLSACGDKTSSAAPSTNASGTLSLAREQEESISSAFEDHSVQIQTFHGEDLYDYENKYEAVGAHSYVFVGEVVEIVGTEYPFQYTQTFESGETMEIKGNPYTRLRVKITQSIKGGLPIGETSEMLKLGGYDAETDTYYLCEDDTFPQTGCEYVFLAEKDEADTWIVAAPQTTIPLNSEGSAISSYAPEPQPDRQTIIAQYIDAYEHEIPYQAISE